MKNSDLTGGSDLFLCQLELRQEAKYDEATKTKNSDAHCSRVQNGIPMWSCMSIFDISSPTEDAEWIVSLDPLHPLDPLCIHYARELNMAS